MLSVTFLKRSRPNHSVTGWHSPGKVGEFQSGQGKWNQVCFFKL